MLEIQLCKKTSNLILKILNDTKQNKIEISRKKNNNNNNKTNKQTNKTKQDKQCPTHLLHTS